MDFLGRCVLNPPASENCQGGRALTLTGTEMMYSDPAVGMFVVGDWLFKTPAKNKPENKCTPKVVRQTPIE